MASFAHGGKNSSLHAQDAFHLSNIPHRPSHPHPPNTNDMKTEHTPGPWFAKVTATWPHEHPENARLALNVHGGEGQPGYDGNIITSLAPEPHITAQDWANARLIASAPDLLAALEEMYRVCNVSGDSSPHRMKAAAAIAKAKGEA